jgi:hypothetical protein
MRAAGPGTALGLSREEQRDRRQRQPITAKVSLKPRIRAWRFTMAPMAAAALACAEIACETNPA